MHDDGTTTNETRLGAIGDVRFVRDETGWDDDLLVIAGDNLFDYSLADFVRFAARRARAPSRVYDVGDRELATQYGVIDLDADDRVVGFVEKPAEPPTTLCATATYLYAREHARPRRHATSARATRPTSPAISSPGSTRASPSTGSGIPGGWYDIGDAAQLLEADNRLRELAGLPFRNSYSLD